MKLYELKRQVVLIDWNTSILSAKFDMIKNTFLPVKNEDKNKK